MIASSLELTSSGAVGNAGEGATSLPLLFNPDHHHDDSAFPPPLAIARVGGLGGSVFVYADEPLAMASYGSCSSFAGGGRQWF